MNALRALVIGLAVAVSIVFSSGGAVLAASTQRVSSSAAPDYENTTVATYSIINAWPKKYTGAQPR